MPLGGGSTSILNLCDGLRRDGTWEPHVAVFESRGAVGDQIRQRGHSVHGPCHGILHEDRIAQMLDICRNIRPRVVVAALGGDSFDFLRFVPQDCLRVAMIQSDDIKVYNQVIRYASWIDVVVGVSLEICRKAKGALGNAKTLISYQPYGVPMGEEVSLPVRTDVLRVLYLGRVCEEQKRVALMSRIMRQSLDYPFPIRWTIAGDGDNLPKMRESFADRPQQVSFLGAIPYEQVPQLFARHDVYFLCSDYEGLPLSLLEAMGAGVVPVVSDLASGISEVVNQQNGIRVPIGDEAGYLQALFHLAERQDHLDGMAIHCIAAVRENFSVGSMASRWLNMITNHLASGQPDWSQKTKALPPLAYQNRLKYHPILKPFRRVAKQFFGRK